MKIMMVFESSLEMKGNPKSILRKKLKMIENTPDNWDKDRTKAIARLFLPCKRDY